MAEADPEAASVSVADSVEAGGRFTLGARVRNAGDGAAAANRFGRRVRRGDIERVRAAGALDDLALHEIAHGLGFVDYYWSRPGLVDTAAADPHFTGGGAVAAFDSAGRDSYIGNKVPVSSPDHSHWRETVFGEELMTPALVVGSAQALSAITLEAMVDFGYVVDVSQADDYELPGARPPGTVAEKAGQVLHVGDDAGPTSGPAEGRRSTPRVPRPPP